MRIHRRHTALAACLAVFCCTACSAPAQIVVNIDGRLYGFQFPTDPAPVPGQIVHPFSLAPGGALNQVTLGPGKYIITNATGMPGADPNLTAFRFNGGNNWTWGGVIADDATDKVVWYGDAGGVHSSQAAVAADPAVQNYASSFTLGSTTKLDFMVRDYYLPDNAGGVALFIRPAVTAVPEPGVVSLAAACTLAILAGAWRRRRRSA